MLTSQGSPAFPLWAPGPGKPLVLQAVTCLSASPAFCPGCASCTFSPSPSRVVIRTFQRLQNIHPWGAGRGGGLHPCGALGAAGGGTPSLWSPGGGGLHPCGALGGEDSIPVEPWPQSLCARRPVFWEGLIATLTSHMPNDNRHYLNPPSFLWVMRFQLLFRILNSNFVFQK